MKKICLIGFMGSGKTTVGEAVAKLLHKPWVDLDTYIACKAEASISQIFSKYGEAYFRELEFKCLKEVLEDEKSILSTGGGIIVTPANIPLLQEQMTVYLAYPFETLYERIAGDKNRPLAVSRESLEERFESRLSLYEKTCRIKINCEGKSIKCIAEEIISKLEITI